MQIPKSDNCWSSSIRRFFGSASEVANRLQDGFRIGISRAKEALADARPTRRDEKTKELPDELEEEKGQSWREIRQES